MQSNFNLVDVLWCTLALLQIMTKIKKERKEKVDIKSDLLQVGTNFADKWRLLGRYR
jgi:hypothetical protein